MLKGRTNIQNVQNHSSKLFFIQSAAAHFYGYTYSKLMVLRKYPLPCSIFILTFNYIEHLLSGTINQQWGNGVLFLFLYSLPVALGKILNAIKNTKYSRFIESYKKVHKVQQYSLLFPSIPGPSLFLLSPSPLFRTPIQKSSKHSNSPRASFFLSSTIEEWSFQSQSRLTSAPLVHHFFDHQDPFSLQRTMPGR